MSVQNERLMILEMLKEGKISVDEAQRLLDAVANPVAPATPAQPAAPAEQAKTAYKEDEDDDDEDEDDDNETQDSSEYTKVTYDPSSDELSRALKQTAKEASRAAREAARQVRHEMREVERQMREVERQMREEMKEAARAAKQEAREAQHEAREAHRQSQREGERLRVEAERLAAKLRAAAVDTAEEVTREGGYLDGLFSLFERSPGFDIFGSSYRTETVQEGTFAANARVDLLRDVYTPTDKQIRINIYTANGRIVIRGWNEETFRMTLNASVKASSAEEAKAKLEKMLIVTQTPEMLFVDGRAFVGSNVGMSVELWLPRCYQYEMDLKGSNGRVLLEDLHAQGLEVSTSNGRLELSDVIAKVAKLRSSNGSIVCDTDISLLTAHSSNGSVRIRTSKEAANTFDIMTSNGSIKIEVRDCEGLAHDLDLKTSGKINVDLPGAIGGFSEGKSTRLQSLTPNFEDYEKKLRVSARTSNGTIRISGIDD